MHEPPHDPATPESILIMPVPIHERPLAVNPQNASPLFNGRIPPEIRDSIFQYALVEYTKTDLESIYPIETNYTRPGYIGKRTISITLLLTCRRAYLETYHLPPTNKEYVFWHGRHPPGEFTDRLLGLPESHEKYYFERLQDWQMKLVKGIHLFTQMYWLEGTFPKLCEQEFMQGMEKVKITIRRGDWWWNERNHPLAINPQRGSSNEILMFRDWKAEKEGQVIAWHKGGWGYSFAKLKSLKELEMEFETTDDKKGELMKIVEKAKTWKFPYSENEVLSTEGLEERASTWEAPMCFWTEACPYCGEKRECRVEPTMKKKCENRTNMRADNRGPLCHVVSVRFRVRDTTVSERS